MPDNEVTRLRDFMDITGQKKWGFVIYRCTYGNDASWDRFLKILDERVREAFDLFNDNEKRGVLEKLEWRIESDRATLDGASTSDVRARFREWVNSDEAEAEKGDGVIGMPRVLYIGGLCPRYMFCLHVDAESLDSVVNRAPQPPNMDMNCVGWVNLVDLHWELPDPAAFDDSREGSEPETDDSSDDEFEPIEGIRTDNVGFMRVCVDGLAPAIYAMLQKSGMFDTKYVRPPEIMGRI